MVFFFFFFLILCLHSKIVCSAMTGLWRGWMVIWILWSRNRSF